MFEVPCLAHEFFFFSSSCKTSPRHMLKSEMKSFLNYSNYPHVGATVKLHAWSTRKSYSSRPTLWRAQTAAESRTWGVEAAPQGH